MQGIVNEFISWATACGYDTWRDKGVWRNKHTAAAFDGYMAAHIKRTEDLKYVEAYLESAAESEKLCGLLMSANLLLEDVRNLMTPNAGGKRNE